MTVCPAKTQINMGIRPVWSEFSLSAWRKLGSLATPWAHSKDSDQTGQMPRLIWVFTGPTVILLALSWGGSIIAVLENLNELQHNKTNKWPVRSAKTQISLLYQMPRLIWVFTGPTVILLALSWGGSIIAVLENLNELQHNKTNKWPVRSAKTQISLRFCTVLSVFTVCRNKHWVLGYP